MSKNTKNPVIYWRPHDVLRDLGVAGGMAVEIAEDFGTSEDVMVKTVEVENIRLDVTDGGGRDNNYYLCNITHPKRCKPATVECEDIIRHLSMTFDEGEAFKAIWRNAALRSGGGKPGDSELRNGEKVEHYGAGMQLCTQIERDRVGK